MLYRQCKTEMNQPVHTGRTPLHESKLRGRMPKCYHEIFTFWAEFAPEKFGKKICSAQKDLVRSVQKDLVHSAQQLKRAERQHHIGTITCSFLATITCSFLANIMSTDRATSRAKRFSENRTDFLLCICQQELHC